MHDKYPLYFSFLNASRMHHVKTHKVLSEIGIYHGQPRLLFLLEEKEGLSQREVADALKTTAATITVMLKRMEKSELIIRKQDPKDKRISRVYLTKQGKDVCIDAKKAIETLAQESFEGFTLQEKYEFEKLLEKMSNNLKED